MEILIIGLVSIGVSVGIVGVVMDKVQKHLQGQINQLRKDKHELTLRVIQLEGKTNGHDIQLNSVKFKTDINEISLKYLTRKEGVK